MPQAITVALSPPIAIIRVPGAGATALAAACPMVFRANLPTIDVDCDLLGPARSFNHIATIFIDNTANSAGVMVTFLDSNVTSECPAGSTIYILGITALKRVRFSSVVAADTAVNVAILNFNAGPTGVQPVTGTVTAVIGPITVTNPGPASVALLDDSAAVPATTPTQLFPANPNRKYFLAQFPAGIAGVGSSDGWYSFTNPACAPSLPGCFYAGAGEKIWSEVVAPTNPLYVYLNSAGEMPVVTG